VSKKEDEEITGGGGKDEPEPDESASNISVDVSPRAARFGEGREGRAARRERGVAGARAGFFERTGQFLHDVREELKRVAWPKGREVRNTTIITIIAVIFFAIYLKLVDEGFALLIGQLERLINWLFGLV
jgi:preprotein translocase subunit SecE